MPDNPILAEIRAFRAAHAAKFGYDLAAIVQDLRSREGSDGRPVVRPPSRDATGSEPLPESVPMPARADQPAA